LGFYTEKMRKLRPVQMWVHPSFKKRCKIDAEEQDKSLLEYTEELAKRDKNERRNKKRLFDFRI